MSFQEIIPNEPLSLFIKSILIFENSENSEITKLPFFADGYPGLLFHKTDGGLTVIPHHKEMPDLFIYGQTINPIELEIKGSYSIIVAQLYPFVLKSFYSIDPKSINDNCYIPGDTEEVLSNLRSSGTTDDCIELIKAYLLNNFEKRKDNLDFKIRRALEMIIAGNGTENIGQIAKELDFNIRTFERRFLTETGLSPKQFAKIIQFQTSLQRLTAKDYNKLSDIVYENGFSDQSHFIRVFKAFTGKTPKSYSS
ncbi:helix-turn-helix domain-containing protein [Elizabethkingia anophelis]|uniref:AraC family transcriptional regulator n=1 Tax=Elizabethkingia anophelis TaxID=1117645 RepID=A0A494J8S7_9FLAO|nr:helix-turn-helix domain-containing protein [Elizabethkingia anophelis]AQX51273.1 AraC family transcriptional regulator [Elizabethkingia anophelis]MCT4196745.1 helix-turn-helix transcriptional regulator [Elizabethkingia anophelis]MCT4225311.1 helix-turn-helix transcriptional regulator [Elizabethkingia anophelis]MCT4306902.1 helix-turn-helix transcriptional regulator [Elizabethkingia anophelis]MDV2472661.1 AraC family transcriptional regulator [Elizabethkingia anophelis]